MEQDSWWVKLRRNLAVEIHVMRSLGIVKYVKFKI
jgi:hypothetical protein